MKNLQEVSRPKYKAELRSFIEMAGSSESFIPNFATIVQPLRQQMKQTSWGWEEASEEAFIKLKESLSEHSLLHHYVIGRDTELVVDASLTGLGAVLVQRASTMEPFQPVMYKSRSLKEVKTRYSPTEREALAIRWACRKLRKYLLGAPKFRIVTDHRPLTYMFHKLCGSCHPGLRTSSWTCRSSSTKSSTAQGRHVSQITCRGTMSAEKDRVEWRRSRLQ